MKIVQLKRTRGKTPYDFVLKKHCGPNYIINRKDAFKTMIKEQGTTFWFRFWLTFCFQPGCRNLEKLMKNGWKEPICCAFIHLHRNFVQALVEDAVKFCFGSIIKPMISMSKKCPVFKDKAKEQLAEELFELTMMSFGCALCEVFFKWNESESDYNFNKSYWNVPSEYFEPNFVPGSLEKYLVQKWKMKFFALLGVKETDVPWIKALLDKSQCESCESGVSIPSLQQYFEEKKNEITIIKSSNNNGENHSECCKFLIQNRGESKRICLSCMRKVLHEIKLLIKSVDEPIRKKMYRIKKKTCLGKRSSSSKLRSINVVNSFNTPLKPKRLQSLLDSNEKDSTMIESGDSFLVSLPSDIKPKKNNRQELHVSPINLPFSDIETEKLNTLDSLARNGNIKFISNKNARNFSVVNETDTCSVPDLVTSSLNDADASMPKTESLKNPSTELVVPKIRVHKVKPKANNADTQKEVKLKKYYCDIDIKKLDDSKNHRRREAVLTVRKADLHSKDQASVAATEKAEATLTLNKIGGKNVLFKSDSSDDCKETMIISNVLFRECPCCCIPDDVKKKLIEDNNSEITKPEQFDFNYQVNYRICDLFPVCDLDSYPSKDLLNIKKLNFK